MTSAKQKARDWIESYREKVLLKPAFLALGNVKPGLDTGPPLPEATDPRRTEKYPGARHEELTERTLKFMLESGLTSSEDSNRLVSNALTVSTFVHACGLPPWERSRKGDLLTAKFLSVFLFTDDMTLDQYRECLPELLGIVESYGDPRRPRATPSTTPGQAFTKYLDELSAQGAPSGVAPLLYVFRRFLEMQLLEKHKIARLKPGETLSLGDYLDLRRWTICLDPYLQSWQASENLQVSGPALADADIHQLLQLGREICYIENDLASVERDILQPHLDPNKVILYCGQDGHDGVVEEMTERVRAEHDERIVAFDRAMETLLERYSGADDATTRTRNYLRLVAHVVDGNHTTSRHLLRVRYDRTSPGLEGLRTLKCIDYRPEPMA